MVSETLSASNDFFRGVDNNKKNIVHLLFQRNVCCNMQQVDSMSIIVIMPIN